MEGNRAGSAAKTSRSSTRANPAPMQ
jgi:hypothetical protein